MIAFYNKEQLLTQLILTVMKRLSKKNIWSTLLYRSETWIIETVEKINLEAFNSNQVYTPIIIIFRC